MRFLGYSFIKYLLLPAKVQDNVFEAILSFLYDGHYCELNRTELAGLFRDCIVTYYMKAWFEKPTFSPNFKMPD